MANTFITMPDVAAAAAVLTESRLVLAGALDHQCESRFGRGTGKTVVVRTAGTLTPARDLIVDGTAQKDTLNETSVDVKLEKHFYKQVELSAIDRSLEIEDFSAQVLTPIIDSIVAAIETYAGQKLAANAGGRTGDSFSAPATLADCARANRWFTERRIIPSGRYAFIGPETEEALLQLDPFVNSSYGQDGPQALRDATIGRRLGMDFVVNPYATQVAAIPGTLKVGTGGAKKGDKTILVTGITASTAIPAGAQLTIGGATYFVAEPVASAAATDQPIALSVPLKAAASAEASITSSAYSQSFVCQKSCAAIAIVAPEASQGASSSVASHRGIAIRATTNFNDGTLGDVLTLDVLAGMRVLHPDAAALFTAKA